MDDSDIVVFKRQSGVPKFVKHNSPSIDGIDILSKNKFRWDWMSIVDVHNELFSHYFRKIKKDGYVWCLYCKSEIKYATGGVRCLKDHSRTKCHFKLREFSLLQGFCSLVPYSLQRLPSSQQQLPSSQQQLPSSQQQLPSSQQQLPSSQQQLPSNQQQLPVSIQSAKTEQVEITDTDTSTGFCDVISSSPKPTSFHFHFRTEQEESPTSTESCTDPLPSSNQSLPGSIRIQSVKTKLVEQGSYDLLPSNNPSLPTSFQSVKTEQVELIDVGGSSTEFCNRSSSKQSVKTEQVEPIEVDGSSTEYCDISSSKQSIKTEQVELIEVDGASTEFCDIISSSKPTSFHFQQSLQTEQEGSPTSTESCDFLPSSSTSAVLDSVSLGNSDFILPQTTSRPVSLKERIFAQEALICSFIVGHSLPLSLAPDLISLAKQLAKDKQALQSLSVWKDKQPPPN